ncbi:hypothetical protein AVT_27640 (plasmid) [Bacillus tropicus]|uniref:Uncharacterized protein n=1 Tax=Bacillus shihchuchen TaxID=3036942 RepID=A0ABT7KZ18_9BACI|nr:MULTISPECIES: hypothetical protein [Bacillus]MDL2419351.1 hypothetical protein [Bacillus shihchuchen]WBO93053.1 hypothetical protein AVT_27640 [Bacillus tropicus]
MPGFLKFVLAKERRYVYLTVVEKKNKRVKTHIVYRFGLPELKDKGYDWEDLNDWILSIETGYSKYGNKLVTF